jgi:hypothetical protein
VSPLSSSRRTCIRSRWRGRRPAIGWRSSPSRQRILTTWPARASGCSPRTGPASRAASPTWRSRTSWVGSVTAGWCASHRTTWCRAPRSPHGGCPSMAVPRPWPGPAATTSCAASGWSRPPASRAWWSGSRTASTPGSSGANRRASVRRCGLPRVRSSPRTW